MLLELFFIISIFSSFILTTPSSHTQCLPHQKTLLLQLRNELIFNSSHSTKLVRWNESDKCCKWHGVECDAAGHVVSLQLDDESIYGGIGDSSSLFRLKYLQNLNLANNELNGTFPNMIFQIPTLQNLDLSRNIDLSGSLPPFTQNGSLESIRLGRTNFSGSIPSSISNLKHLSYIDLSFCQFTGSIPSTFANLTRLTHADLSNNRFTSSLSSTLFEGFSNLDHLHLEYNSFVGNIPHSLFGLPSLHTLRLANNRFTGQVGDFHTVNVSNIVTLDLSGNRLEGPILNSFLQLQSLESLDLSNNTIVGEIPSWIWGKQLEYLNLGFNLLTEVQKPYHIPASLTILDLWSNQLGGKLHLPIPLDIEPNLETLLLGNNSFSGSIPTSLCSATKLQILELCDNNLSGGIPSCLLDDNMGLNILDLGRNNISGHIPNKLTPLCNLQYVDLNNNTLEGKLPKSLEHCDSLEFLNVGNNLINDTFPCMLSGELLVLVLHSNRFHGEVRCQNKWPHLQIVDISSNNFSGSLESIDFSSWTGMRDGLESYVPRTGLGERLPSQVPIPTRNMICSREKCNIVFVYVTEEYKIGVELTMKGLERELHKIWPDFSAIDFSCNNFHGEIPNAIGDLRSLRVLNFSYNALNGGIPKSFGRLKVLESLDLSQNQLSGAIPAELAQITFLSVLNLSYNKLVGEIPNGRQLQTFSADSFRGNPGLCGFNLNISCWPTTDDGSGLSPGEDENEEEKKEIEWEYVSAALGYIVGLGSIVWLLLFCRRFRVKYFGKIEEVVEDIFHARDMRRRRARRARALTDRRNRVRRH